MKKSRIVFSLLLGVGMLAATSCGKSSNSSRPSPVAENKIEVPAETKTDTTANHSVKPINLRQADSFAVLAHESISSIPNSVITGKVGLRPGTRAMIGLDPTEVVGGLPEIFAGDDQETSAAAFIAQAKLDMINAYNDGEVGQAADADKINLFNGYLGGKVLAAGVYYWNSRVTIPLDLRLVGTEKDVFIFKVAGDLRVGTDVKVTLSGGAQAKNVFWVVGDHVLIKANSAMVGTIISQESFEMREYSTLVGRAFVKNSKLMLDKNTITRP
ncbi:MAG: ice-binding family protein [Bacteriovorax sp.]